MQKRQAGRDDGLRHADSYADCSACHGLTNETQRASMRCGWVPRHEWIEGYMPIPDGCDVQPDCCPGYLIGIPAVIEAARASSWRQDGALREFYDGEPLTDICKFAIDTFIAESKVVEGYVMRKQREAMKNGS